MDAVTVTCILCVDKRRRFKIWNPVSVDLETGSYLKNLLRRALEIPAPPPTLEYSSCFFRWNPNLEPRCFYCRISLLSLTGFELTNMFPLILLLFFLFKFQGSERRKPFSLRIITRWFIGYLLAGKERNLTGGSRFPTTTKKNLFRLEFSGVRWFRVSKRGRSNDLKPYSPFSPRYSSAPRVFSGSSARSFCPPSSHVVRETSSCLFRL